MFLSVAKKIPDSRKFNLKNFRQQKFDAQKASLTLFWNFLLAQASFNNQSDVFKLIYVVYLVQNCKISNAIINQVLLPNIITYLSNYLFFQSVGLWGRKPFLMFVQILSGLSCITAGLVNNSTIQLVASLIGKFGSSAAFAIVFLFTAELFPTSMRNSAVGLCSTLARLGGNYRKIIIRLYYIYISYTFSSKWNCFKRFHSLCLYNEEWKIKWLM